MSEFDVTNGYDYDPAFIWWVSKVIIKCARLISKVKYCCSKRKIFKVCLEVPVTVENALRLCKQNGNTLWKDDTNKEVKNS